MQSRSLVFAGWFFLAASVAFGQWVQQESGTTEDLMDVSAQYATWVTVVGNNGTIRLTMNGTEWTPQVGVPGVDYQAVSYISSTGLAAGTNGTISRSPNQGNIWPTVVTGGTDTYYAAHQPLGMVGGAGGGNSGHQALISRSSDGWQSHDFLSFYPFFDGSFHEGAITDIYFFTGDSCVATVALTEGGGAICWTAEAGSGNWQTQYVSEHTLNGLDFADEGHAVVVGDDGMVLTTSDGGWTWELHTLLTDANLNDVAYGADTAHVWAVGASGTILRSLDGGLDWSAEDSPVAADLNGVSMIDNDTGYVAGDEGTILFTGDGGALPNLPPGEFWRLLPADGSTISTPVIQFVWTRAVDPEGDVVRYHGRVWSPYLAQFGVDTLEFGSINDTTNTLEIPWPVDPLDELYPFYWSLYATDGYNTVEPINGQGEFVNNIVESANNQPDLPREFSLSAYPNPFNPTTTLSLSLPVSSEAVMRVFDVTGRVVREMRLGRMESGLHEVSFDGTELPSGLYFATLETPRVRITQKLVMVK